MGMSCRNLGGPPFLHEGWSTPSCDILPLLIIPVVLLLSAGLAQVSKAEAEEELRTSRKTITLDVAAANRFISAAVPELNAQQRRKLKESADAAKAAVKAAGAQGKRGAETGSSGPPTGAPSKRHKKGSSSGKASASMPSVRDAALQFLDHLDEDKKGI